VTVTAGTLPGEFVNNTATVNNPNGPENNPAAPTLTVNPSLIPATGTKFLYVRNAGSLFLSRTVPTSGTDAIRTVAASGSDAFTITPPLRTAFSINAGAIPVRLWLRRGPILLRCLRGRLVVQFLAPLQHLPAMRALAGDDPAPQHRGTQAAGAHRRGPTPRGRGSQQRSASAQHAS